MPTNLIILDERSFTDRAGIEELLRSNDSRASRIRKEAEEFISRSVEETGSTVGIETDSFRLALWILSAIDESVLTARVINQQRDYLEKALNKVFPEDLEAYAQKAGTGISYDVEDGLFSIPFEEFLRNSRRLSGSRYRLVYQAVKGGLVYAGKETMAKMIREHFVARTFGIVDNIDVKRAREVLGERLAFAERMKKLYREHHAKKTMELGEIDFKLFPPCIKEFLKELHDGVNLPHIARLTLASFLHKVGMKTDNIAEQFKTAPDYDPRTTEYQVKHITGEISGVEYSPPKCTTLQANHICYKGEDTLCNQEWLKHPLWYYEVKKRKSN